MYIKNMAFSLLLEILSSMERYILDIYEYSFNIF